MTLENDSGNVGNGAISGVILEAIDADSDGTDDWVILAAARQQIYYSGGLKVTWYNGFNNSSGERVLPQNVYRLLSCRKTKDLVLFQPPETKENELTGALYASPDVCEHYRSTGALTPPDEITNDGLWWMDDRKIIGHELSCNITSWTTDSIQAHCQLDGETGLKTYSFQTTGKVREIMAQRLQLCSRID